MTPKRTPAASGIVLMLALVIGGWLIQRAVGRSDATVMEARLLDEVVDYIADLYVEDVDREQLYEYAIDGILEELGDPNTSVLDTSAYEDFRIQTEGDYGGLGIEITDRDEFITVVAPLPGTPASRAGIRTGDRIIEVAGEEARGWSVHWYDREHVFRDAAAVLGCEDINALLVAMGRSIGAPWQAKHKLAAAAALAAKKHPAR